MRTLGLIGGTSWLSTRQYYTRLNELAGEAAPGQTCKLVLVNTEWAEFQAMDWEQRYGHHLDAAKRLARAGAEAVLICANTLHRFAPRLTQDQHLPIISILDAIADEVKSQGFSTSAILGTRVTMTEEFYAGRLHELGLRTVVPDESQMDELDRTIFEEFARDVFSDATARYYLGQIDRLKAKGAECVILGCTEIPLLLAGRTASLPMIDTIEVHCRAGIRFALGSD